MSSAAEMMQQLRQYADDPCHRRYQCALIPWDQLDAAIARLEAAEAVVAVIRAAGPFPAIAYTEQGPYCVHCNGTPFHSMVSAREIQHVDGCAGVRIAALLDATGTERDGE